MAYPEAMARLLQELEKLPGIGPRTAERLAHHMVQGGRDGALALAAAIESVVSTVKPCSGCRHLTDRDPCPICSDASRDRRRILVVEQPRDLEALERAGWRGLYHVLHGSLRADGGGEPLALDALRRRLDRDAGADEILELVLGTDPDFEGDGTALEIAAMVRASRRPELPISRLARGVPTGSSIEYSNPAVLAEALAERRAIGRGQAAEDAP
ncbi:MAG: recombination protein RecR [Planctomycetes bacterium]|nr:recombination protein RecR [Planctomycetota bacterium]